MDKKLLKYKKWHKWVISRNDVKAAYKVFIYWLKIRNEQKQITVNFNLSPKLLRESIKKQYVDKKYLQVFNKIKAKFDLNCFNDESITNLIKRKISSVAYTGNELEYMLNQWLNRVGFDERYILSEISQKMDDINKFYENTKKDNLLRYLSSNNIGYLEIKEKNKEYVVTQVSPTEMLKLSSPSWCLMHNNKHMESYYSTYSKIIVAYVFNNNNSFNMYGLNVLFHGFNGKDIEYLERVYDMYNDIVINEDTLYLSNKLRTNPKDTENIFRANVGVHIKIGIALNAIKSKELLKGFLIASIKNTKEVNNIIEYFITSQQFDALKRFVELFTDDIIYKEWIKCGINCLNKNVNIHEKEIELIYNYLFSSKDKELISLLLKNKRKRLTKRQFEYIYKNFSELVLDLEEVLFHLNKIKEKDFAYVKNNLKLKVSDRGLIQKYMTYAKKDRRLLNILKLKLKEDFLTYLDYDTYKLFSVKEREKILESSNNKHKAIKYAELDCAVSQDKIIKPLIKNALIPTYTFLSLNEKLRKKYKQLFFKNIEKQKNYKLCDSDVALLGYERLYSIRKVVNTNNSEINKCIINEIFRNKNHLWLQVYLNELKNEDKMDAYNDTLFFMARWCNGKFKTFYELSGEKNIDLLLDIYIYANKTYPSGGLIASVNSSEVLRCIQKRRFIKEYADYDAINGILVQIKLLECSPKEYVKYAKWITKVCSEIRIKIASKKMKAKFIKKYGYFKYYKTLLSIN